jgi:hypothetical protein
MTTVEINVLLAVRRKSISGIAAAIKEERAAVSQTINYLRENRRIRKKVAAHLGMPVDELFDPMHQRETVGV